MNAEAIDIMPRILIKLNGVASTYASRHEGV
jgi:hypothetical protein